MTAVRCEEVRERRRLLFAKLGTENPRLDDLKLGSQIFQFPRIWDLTDPLGNYQRVILPRQSKAMARLLNKQLHEHVTKEKRSDHRKTAGPTEPDLGRSRPLHPFRPMEPTNQRLTLKQEDPKAGENAKAYPAGKRLKSNGPSRMLLLKARLLDAACHIGCNRPSCPHAHAPLPALSKLDYTIATQVLRRGGLRNGPKINPNEVDGRIAQLRTQVKDGLGTAKIESGDTARSQSQS